MIVVILRKLIWCLRKVCIVILLVVFRIVGCVFFVLIVLCVSCNVGKCIGLGVLNFSLLIVIRLSGVIGVVIWFG